MQVSSLWKAVKIAKDVNITGLPHTMYKNNVPIDTNFLQDSVASYFNEKFFGRASGVNVDNQVYNGSKKFDSTNKMFMDEGSIKECMLSLKIKNTEGFDSIPQRVLVDNVSLKCCASKTSHGA